MPGTTAAQKYNQASARNMGVICFGCPFLLLFWASKKVNKETYAIIH